MSIVTLNFIIKYYLWNLIIAPRFYNRKMNVDQLKEATDTPIRNIRVFNIYGKEVAHASDTDRINLSHLPAGVYTVITDGKTARMFKK